MWLFPPKMPPVLRLGQKGAYLLSTDLTWVEVCMEYEQHEDRSGEDMTRITHLKSVKSLEDGAWDD